MKNKHRVLLNVKRWKQKPEECAIAAASCLASFYDNDIKYSSVRKLIPPKVRKKGFYSSQQAKLLNQLGYSKVTIVTADLDYVDFAWSKLDQEALIKKLKKMRAYCGRAGQVEIKNLVIDMIGWLELEGYDNQLRIDQDFPKWIKMYLDNGRPVGAAFNWTALHRFSKGKVRPGDDDIKGGEEHHAVVIRGYDDDGVFIVDSHSQFYKGKWAKYRNGYYKISWNKFLTNAPIGDLILVG